MEHKRRYALENVRISELYECTYKSQILLSFILTRELKEVIGTMMLDYLANDSIESSSSSDKRTSISSFLSLLVDPKVVLKCDCWMGGCWNN